MLTFYWDYYIVTKFKLERLNMSDNNYQTGQKSSEGASELYSTKRATVPALEKLLYEHIPVLDHGFIRVIDYTGDDNAIVQAARVSYGKGTKMVSQDKGLINYLMRHRHTMAH
jgi:thymidylate synthase (FAD)